MDKNKIKSLHSESFRTPLGIISVLYDGKPIPFDIDVAYRNERWTEVDVVARIYVHCVPDGKKHELTCRLTTTKRTTFDYENGEDLECIAVYSADRKIKISMGMKGDAGYSNGERIANCDYDLYTREHGKWIEESFEKYDSEYKGVWRNQETYEVGSKFDCTYLLLDFTKTEEYVFGLAWLTNCNEENDVETWLACDPSIEKYLK